MKLDVRTTLSGRFAPGREAPYIVPRGTSLNNIMECSHKDVIKELLFGFLFLFIELFHGFGEHLVETNCKDLNETFCKDHSIRSLRARGRSPLYCATRGPIE